MSSASHRETGRTMGRLDQLVDEAARLIEEIRQEVARQWDDQQHGKERGEPWPPKTSPPPLTS